MGKPPEVRMTNLEALAQEAQQLVDMLVPGAGATLVTLSGDLGAGKTAFAKAVAKALGVEEVVNSPTFVLEKNYALPQGDGHGVSFKRLVHIDAYRLESGTELGPLGFDELMKDPGNLVLLEWPEKVAGALPPAAVAITLRAESDGTHVITYAG